MNRTIASRFIATIALSTLLLFYGCATSEYLAPAHQGLQPAATTRIFNNSFDDVWKAFISYASSSFFSISVLEKDSGFLAADFTSSKPELFVSGGTFSLNGGLDSNYAAYLRSRFGLTLSGKINVTITQIDENRTRVFINTRYVVDLPPSSKYDILSGGNIAMPGTVWTFNSDGYSTQAVSDPAYGAGQFRTFCATGKIEKDILDGIEANL